jgi:Flp pilus assembly protein TadD
MRTWLNAAIVSVSLCACATPPAPPMAPAAAILNDPLFAPPSEVIDGQSVFALDDAMKEYVHSGIAAELRRDGPRRGLVHALYDTNQLKLHYDSSMTRNAAQAFDARAGNCLSLVIMTAAFAKELGLPVRYHSVYTDATWSRSGDIYFASTHVNVTLGNRIVDSARISSDDRDETTVDFLPAEDLRSQRWHEIDEATIVAMYLNNRAAEALAQGQLDNAYWWARAAITEDPKFLEAVNTLGVIYLRHGNAREAENVFRDVLDAEPENASALSNIALVYRNEGRLDESAAALRRLAQIEPYPPLHYFNLGLAALRQGDFKGARDLFRKELRRSAYYHEVHFGLALAYYGLGNVRSAADELNEAIEDSTTRAEHNLYAAKLAWLNSRRADNSANQRP